MREHCFPCQNCGKCHPVFKRGLCPVCFHENKADAAVCEACGAWLDLERVRLGYLEEAGMMHITRKPADAARWVSEMACVHVSGRDLKNWRHRGLLHPRHVEGAYWEWNIKELVDCVVTMRHRG